jgi:hypothetical protein
MANTYEEDPRLEAVKEEEKALQQQIQDTYGGMAQGVTENLQQQQAATQEWADQQKQLQQEQTDFTIQQIEQQKEQTQKDLAKEQSAAYTDYQKQTAKHGVNAEKMAQMGMTGSGYSESSNVAMYTAYQNRVATARASAEQAMVSFNNAITQARLQNSSAMAQIAFDGLQTQLQLGLQALQYSNDIIAQQLGLQMDAKNMHHGQYMDILGQINQEKAFAENMRQYEEQFAYQKSQDALDQQNWEKQYNLSIAQQQQEEKLKSASLMASAGDFSGYKNLFGLTDAQVKKLEEAYKEETEPEDPPIQLSVLGNDNTKAAENAIMDEKGFNQYKTTIRTRVNGKSFTNYQDYVLAKIEDMANNGLNGRKFTDEEIEWLLAKYGDL